ncbi:hypothetical protein [Dellaglioa algida]|uniref:hypothetical protein n=1 Tax=Dellaglioa algida TaxID=105612 RepID=UPI0024C4D5CF|nr:hypothetical protein [Dellaglioa algida]MDK1727836.1 hypothetical protein [Dellaglioa algida]
MSHYQHFTANEREKILLGVHSNLSIRSIVKASHRIARHHLLAANYAVISQFIRP